MEFGIVRAIGLVCFGTLDVGVAVYSRYYGKKGDRTSYSAHLVRIEGTSSVLMADRKEGQFF